MYPVLLVAFCRLTYCVELGSFSDLFNTVSTGGDCCFCSHDVCQSSVAVWMPLQQYMFPYNPYAK